jgi:transcription antitermination factor NusG
MSMTALDRTNANAPAAPASSVPSWYAVWTRRQCEQSASEDLAARGFETFLPRTMTWVERQRRRRRVLAPLFPGYLFLRHALDDSSHAAVRRAPGVVRLLGDGPRPLTVTAEEIDAVRRLTESGLPLSRGAVLASGDRVRVIGGPLAGLEGRFLRSHARKGLFVIGVTLLRRAVAVEVDAAFVEAL